MEFPGKLRKLMKRRRVSQEALAAEADVHQTMVSRWGRGKNIPDIRQAHRLAVALGVSLDYLADDALDEPPPEPSDAAKTAAKMVDALNLPEDMVIRVLDDLSASLKSQRRADGPPEITPPLHAPRPGSSPGRSHRSA